MNYLPKKTIYFMILLGSAALLESAPETLNLPETLEVPHAKIEFENKINLLIDLHQRQISLEKPNFTIETRQPGLTIEQFAAIFTKKYYYTF